MAVQGMTHDVLGEKAMGGDFRHCTRGGGRGEDGIDCMQQLAGVAWRFAMLMEVSMGGFAVEWFGVEVFPGFCGLVADSHSVGYVCSQGFDKGTTSAGKSKTVFRKEAKSDNVYLKLLVKVTMPTSLSLSCMLNRNRKLEMAAAKERARS